MHKLVETVSEALLRALVLDPRQYMHGWRDGRWQPSQGTVAFLLQSNLLRFNVLVNVFQVELVLSLVDLQVLPDFLWNFLSVIFREDVVIMSYLVSVLSMNLVATIAFVVIEKQGLRAVLDLGLLDELLGHLHQHGYLDLTRI